MWLCVCVTAWKMKNRRLNDFVYFDIFRLPSKVKRSVTQQLVYKRENLRGGNTLGKNWPHDTLTWPITSQRRPSGKLDRKTSLLTIKSSSLYTLSLMFQLSLTVCFIKLDSITFLTKIYLSRFALDSWLVLLQICFFYWLSIFLPVYSV